MPELPPLPPRSPPFGGPGLRERTATPQVPGVSDAPDPGTRPSKGAFPLAECHRCNYAPVVTYEVHTPVFEGPFDLLLHLILREQVDLYEVSLSRIVDAYVAAA